MALSSSALSRSDPRLSHTMPSRPWWREARIGDEEAPGPPADRWEEGKVTEEEEVEEVVVEGGTTPALLSSRVGGLGRTMRATPAATGSPAQAHAGRVLLLAARRDREEERGQREGEGDGATLSDVRPLDRPDDGGDETSDGSPPSYPSIVSSTSPSSSTSPGGGGGGNGGWQSSPAPLGRSLGFVPRPLLPRPPAWWGFGVDAQEGRYEEQDGGEGGGEWSPDDGGADKGGGGDASAVPCPPPPPPWWPPSSPTAVFAVLGGGGGGGRGGSFQCPCPRQPDRPSPARHVPGVAAPGHADDEAGGRGGDSGDLLPGSPTPPPAPPAAWPAPSLALLRALARYEELRDLYALAFRAGVRASLRRRSAAAGRGGGGGGASSSSGPFPRGGLLNVGGADGAWPEYAVLPTAARRALEVEALEVAEARGRAAGEGVRG
jgi:hypothetical protein